MPEEPVNGRIEVYKSVGYIRFSSTPNRTNNYYIGANISDSVDGGLIIGKGTSIVSGTPFINIENSGAISFKANAGNLSHSFNFNENGGEIILWSNTGSTGSLIDLFGGDTRLLHVLSTGNQQIGLGSANTTGAIQFMGAGFAERMRVSATGKLLLGTTSDTHSGPLCRQQVAFYGGGSEYGLGFKPLTDNTYALFFANSSAVQVGSIHTSPTATTYNTSSDYRLKTNVHPLQNALARIAQLKPCAYTWKTDGSAGEGFIAHELQAVVPQCVTGKKDAVDACGNPVYQGVDTSFLVATLVAAIQELKSDFDAYKATHP